ncbi:MAG: hypothetical protein HKO95_01845 [Rhodobacteraceae bacterium]|nr:hypothetical protein [Alphaproteobacteria bacterium]MBT8477186.1 hypothetical protein [Alphaproteobacteria bacterium]NNK65460.1 hypothetical protein [Paracoccaceae bacterium]
MTGPVFTQLNDGWNADPNGPMPAVAVDGSTLWLRFKPNHFVYPEYENIPHVALSFDRCARFRFTTVNDEGFYRGQCRFTGRAPKWGEFYEVAGDFEAEKRPEPWTEVSPGSEAPRQYLFYFRDECFEAIAGNWDLTKTPPNLSYKEPIYAA